MPEHRLQPNDEDLEAQIGRDEGIKTVDVKWEEEPSSSSSGSKTENLKDGPSISFNEVGDHESPRGKARHHRFHPHVDWRHHFNLWTSESLPHRSTDAHAVARAEAASWAQMTPLIAATLGPLAVLLGIPSLTQRLHGQIVVDPSDGSSSVVELPYPTLNLALSAVVMFCEVLGNLFLIMRFSNFHTKLMTWMSYIFWMAKSVIGIANYIQFGVAHPETEDIVYLQGFWVPLI